MAKKPKPHQPPPHGQSPGEDHPGHSRNRGGDEDEDDDQSLSPTRMADEKHPTRPEEPADTRRRVAAAIAILLLLAGATVLIVYLVYRPQKPRFGVVAAAVSALNTTPGPPPLVSTTIQLTIVTHNPNHRVSIYYDRMATYVMYRNQALTPPVSLPRLHHERRKTVAVSPVLGGVAVPVAAEVANGLAADEAYGLVGLRVVVVGRLRWKAGAITTRHHRLYVRCNVVVGLRRAADGVPPLLGSPGCKVDV